MAALCKKYPPKPRVEVDISEELGIGSILTEKQSSRPSLRRTFSADMSSKKWIAESGLTKVLSSKELSVAPPDDNSSSYSSSSEEEDDHVEQRKKDMFERPSQIDLWSAIQGEREKDAGEQHLPPYIHPLLKKSASSLSQRSLDMCTETLGSENGSNGCFSDFDELLAATQAPAKDEGRVVVKKTAQPTAKSFPPPLSSATQMRSHRCNGRLVLEAVPVQPRNCLRAERQDGRLLLIIIHPHPNQLPALHKQEENDREEEEEEEEKLEEEELSGAAQLEEAPSCIVGAAVMEQQMMEMTLKRMLFNKLNLHGIIPFRNNSNPIWAAGDGIAGKGMKPQSPTAAPPRQLLSSTAQALNAYDYSWKTSIYPTTYLPPNKLSLSTTTEYSNHGAKKKPFLLQTNDFIMVGCKESKRSLLIWEPRCIATT